MAGHFISTHSIVLVLPMYVSHTPVRGGPVHADATSSRPDDGFTTLSATAVQGAPVALASPLGVSPNSFAVRQQLAETGVEILTQELVDNIGVMIQSIEKNSSMASTVTVGVESESSQTALGRMILRLGDLIHTVASDLTTPHSAMVLASWGAALPVSVHLVVSVSSTVEQVPVELWCQLLRHANIVTVDVHKAAALGSVLATRELGTGIRNLIKPEAALVRRTGIMGCELQHEQGAKRIQVPAFEARVVGTAGIGDTHIATMCTAFPKGGDIEGACSLVNTATATATSHGSILPVPTLEQILHVVKEGKATGLTSQKA